MKAGLYQPDEFKDNCGFGLIAHMQGEPSHTLLQTAIEALTCMTHRGGINADGKTGDGCGLLIQKPDLFLRAVAKEHFAVDLPKQYAVGMVFFNQDPVKAEAARENMNREILAAGLQLVGWRKVPIDTSVLGRLALERLPQIEQVFIARRRPERPGHGDQAVHLPSSLVRGQRRRHRPLHLQLFAQDHHL